MKNQLNGIFTTFDFLNFKFHLDSRLINIFSSCISFHNTDWTSNKSKEAYCKKLDEIILESSSNPKTVVITTDISVKNNVTSSIFYIHSFNNPLKKMLHHTINITSTEIELFAIRCRINQAVKMQNVLYIIVITDAIYVVKKSLILPCIYINNNQLWYLKNSECSLASMWIIL